MKKNDKNFKDKVVLITGASSGIGEALAKVFAQKEAKLALLGRRLDRLEALAKTLPTTAIALQCDVTKDEDLNRCLESIHQQLGPIDVVIANAGFGVIGYTENLNVEDFKRQFETNVYGVLRTFYATLSDLKQTKGRLVLIGSALGKINLPTYSAYAMSKHAVCALAETLYMELAPFDISVTHIMPGYITSEFRDINNLGQYQPGLRSKPPPGLSMTADKAARIIFKAIRARKREKLFTLSGKFGVLIHRFFPGFYLWFLKRLAIKKYK
ncbi:MAG: SDR family NAD(P)-dependent oxidoreductase [Proteobacteria bacterium]|nr:SDR family NAD(P)-dependent oxidoreductase [Pseudomonadota bacterium]